MAGHAYGAIDLGAESGRLIVGVLEGRSLALEEVHRFEHTPYQLPSGLHWDLLGIWGDVVEGLRRAVAWSQHSGMQLVSIGVDTWGVDFALLGRGGELLGLPHCYRDPSHPPGFDQAVHRVGRAALYQATGIQFLPINTLYQLVARHEQEPALLQEARTLLFMPDLFHYYLTGQVTVESTIASTSAMVDPRDGCWAGGLLDRLGLPTQMLRPTIRPGTRIGTLLPHVAEATGAPARLPVVAPASHDTAAAVAAVPARPDGSWAYLSSGTWSLMGVELSEPNVGEAARELSFTNEGGVDGTIRFLKNITGLWLVQECRRQLEREGEAYDYDALTAEAERAEPFRTLVDTAHPPFLHPGQMPAKLAAFARDTGQPEPRTPGQLVRCCLESLALTYRHTLLNLERVLGRRFDVLHVVGGGTKNRLLNRMTASAIGRPVVAGPVEATAVGNVLTQAMGSGAVQDLAQLRGIVRHTFSPETYEPRETEVWERAYERFTGILEA